MKFITPGTLLSGCKVFPHFTQSVLPSWLQMYFSFMVPMLSCTDCNPWPCARLRFSLSGAERTVARAATVARCSNGWLSRKTKALSGEKLSWSLQRRNKRLHKPQCLGWIKPATAVGVSWGSMQVAPSFFQNRRLLWLALLLSAWTPMQNSASLAA